MKLSVISGLILCLCFFQPAGAQHAGYKLYTVSDGLVQSEVTAIQQDAKGFLWIGTKNGISRFDGNSFQTIRDSAGVSAAAVFHIGNLNDSTVWFVTAKGCMLFMYHGNRNILRSYPTDGGYTGYWEQEGKGFFVSAAQKLFQVDHTGLHEKSNFLTERLKGSCAKTGWENLIYSEQDGNFYFRSPAGNLACLRGNKVINLHINSFSGLFQGMDGKTYFFSPAIALTHHLMKDPITQWSNYNGRLKEPSRLYCITDTLVELVADFGMNPGILEHTLLILNKDTMYMSSPQKPGFFAFINRQMTEYKIPFTTSSFMFLDREHNLWLGSPMGLVRLHALQFTSYNESDNLHVNTQMVAEDKNHVIITGGYDKGIQKLTGGKFTNIPMPDLLGSGRLCYTFPGSLKDRNGKVYISTSPYCMITWDGKSLCNVAGLPVTASYSFLEDTITREIYCGSDLGLLTKKQSGPDYGLMKIFPGNKRNKAVSLIMDPTGRILLGGFKGLSFLKGGQVTHLPDSTYPYDEGANAMVKDSRGNIWIGNTKGLWLFDMKKFRKVANPWFNDLVVSLCMIDSAKLFIGGLQGIGFLNLDSFYNTDTAAIRYFNSDNGFTGNECQQNAVCYDSRGKLWVATTDNLQCIDPRNLPVSMAGPQVYIEKISSINDAMKMVPLVISSISKGQMELNYPEHNLRFDFTAPVFRGPSFVMFRYRLEGQDNEWSHPTKERYAVYTNLKPGHYTFKVIACNDEGLWSANPAVFTIYIRPAFWQTWWFLVFMVIVLAGFFFGLGYLVMSRRKRSIQVKLESEKKIAELQLISIRNQIDPHFTFNAMNSIASVILREEKEKAYSFFVKLSNLIRQVLTSGDKVTRTLAEELVFVQNYLEIEKLRFRESFQFRINVIQPINLDQEVPKMVIHTYAENALKHGLLNKKEGVGELTINIWEEESKLHIVLEDNGIGREQARRLAQPSTGKGMMILNFYYDFFDRYNDQKIIHEVTDLYDKLNEPAGTRVTVIIPSGFQYNITANDPQDKH